MSQHSSLQSIGLSTEANCLKEAIIDLYLNVKIRSSDEITKYNEDILSNERDKLQDIDSFLVLDYIRTSVEILLNMKEEDESKKSQRTKKDQSLAEPPKDYEKMLQKLEGDIRTHIRIE